VGIIPGVSNWFRTYGFADIEPGLVIGAYPLDADDVGMLEWLGINRVLNLVEDEEYRPGERKEVESALAGAEIEEYRLSLTDYGGLPPAALEAAVQEVSQWLDEGRRAYVHCRAGWQRSAAVAAGVVAVRKGLDIDEALAYVQAQKPSASPLPHQREDLHAWWTRRGGAGGD
jgi:protein-tyrosine phosphatase